MLPQTTTLRIPSRAVRYLLLQRTHYGLSKSGTRTRGFLGNVCRRSIGKVVEPIRTIKAKRNLTRLYSADVRKDYEIIRDYLLDSAKAILDIGCGLGGIDVLLYQHYRSSGINLHLLDKEGIAEKVYYGFNAEAAHYSSLLLTRELLKLNGVPIDRASTYDIATEGFPNQCKFDVVISLYSWGYHYPVSAYLEPVRTSLASDGIIILDVREETDGKEQLAKHFTVCRDICIGSEDNRRILATNNRHFQKHDNTQ